MMFPYGGDDGQIFKMEDDLDGHYGITYRRYPVPTSPTYLCWVVSMPLNAYLGCADLLIIIIPSYTSLRCLHSHLHPYW